MRPAGAARMAATPMRPAPGAPLSGIPVSKGANPSGTASLPIHTGTTRRAKGLQLHHRAAQRPRVMAGPCRMQSRGSPAARPRPVANLPQGLVERAAGPPPQRPGLPPTAF